MDTENAPDRPPTPQRRRATSVTPRVRQHPGRLSVAEKARRGCDGRGVQGPPAQSARAVAVKVLFQTHRQQPQIAPALLPRGPRRRQPRPPQLSCRVTGWTRRMAGITSPWSCRWRKSATSAAPAGPAVGRRRSAHPVLLRRGLAARPTSTRSFTATQQAGQHYDHAPGRRQNRGTWAWSNGSTRTWR